MERQRRYEQENGREKRWSSSSAEEGAVLVLLKPQASVAGGSSCSDCAGLVGSWMDHDIWFSLPDHRAGQDGGLGLFNGGLARLCSDEWLQLVV